jgi:peptidoglycan/xylan/chitin deacetylase (PgdA/CDA1 family)
MNKKRVFLLFIVIVFLLGTFVVQSGEGFLIKRTYSGNSLKGVPVLLYHHILPKQENNDPENGGIVSLENFELQMDYLAANGYKTVTLEELEEYVLNKRELPPKTVAITFDDGYQSNYLYAYPILKKHGFQATVFLVTSLLNEQPLQFNPEEFDYLSWPELKEMHDVFRFGSHSHSLHWELEGQPAFFHLKAEEIKGDLIYSSQLLGSQYFAYPFGAYDQRAKELLSQSGYRMAFTVKEGLVKPGDDPLELKRLPVFNWTSLRQFAGLLNRRK